jgi:hypothetical protein
MPKKKARRASKRKGADPCPDDGTTASSWRPKKFPGAASVADLEESFLILNAWARALKDWETRVRSMCLIVQDLAGLSQEQFAEVVACVRVGKHSPTAMRDALKRKGWGDPGARRQNRLFRTLSDNVGGASDVVGHPPNPPFEEPFT